MPRQLSWNIINADECTLKFGPLSSSNVGLIEVKNLKNMKRNKKLKTKNAQHHACSENVSMDIEESNRLERLRNSIFCIQSNDELSKRSGDVDSSLMDVLYYDGNSTLEKSAQNQHVDRIEWSPAKSSQPENFTNQQNRKNLLKTLKPINRAPTNLSK